VDKFDRAQQLHRIFSARRRPISKVDLAEKLECSTKTVTRLVDSFRDHWQAPLVYCSDQKGWYYDLKEGEKFELPGLWLTSGELQALTALLHIVQSMEEGLVSGELQIVESAISRLLSARGIEPETFIGSIKYIPLAKRQTSLAWFDTVASALVDRKQLDLEYKDYKGRTTHRSISPQKLIYYRENWHLDAYCHLREALRTFPISRMVRVDQSKRDALSIDGSELNRYFSDSYGIYAGKAKHRAIIRFNAEVAQEIATQKWHPEQEGQWDGDDYLLTIPYSHDTELMMDILRYGEMAEILAPLSLRNKIKERLTGAMQMYC